MISPKQAQTASNVRSLKLLLIAITITVVSTLLFNASHVNDRPNDLPRRSLFLDFFFRPRGKSKAVLIWTTYFSAKKWLPEYETLGCSSPCYITYNRKYLNVSHAIVFHLKDVNPKDLPHLRTENQVWVVLNQEAPPHTHADKVAALQTLINWTVTYRRDSTIYAPYGDIVEGRSHAAPSKGYTNPEEPFVCWIVSHCVTTSRREDYVKRLKRYIPVSIYGRCGNETCPTQNVYNCYKELANHCKFYLSLENAICNDYVTEKLFFAMFSGMVPVVMGGFNYSRYLPKNSYIDVSHYRNAKDLAALLWQLNESDEEYNVYHEWRNHYKVRDLSYHWVCKLCEKLHERNEEKTTLRLDNWWYGNGSCYSWEEYFGFTR